MTSMHGWRIVAEPGEAAELPPSEFMLPDVARAAGVTDRGVLRDCCTCEYREMCVARVVRGGSFVDPECERSLTLKSPYATRMQTRARRDRLMAWLADQPDGARAAEIASELGMAHTTVRLALKHLVAEGRVRVDRSRSTMRFHAVVVDA
jgi:hypothetical protein